MSMMLKLMLLFQSTLPYGSDLISPLLPLISSEFQSTLPYGSDCRLSMRRNEEFIFQSTLPYGSDYELNMTPNDIELFQSTLPYGSDLYLTDSQDIDRKISIHAPLRERPVTPFGIVYTSNFNPRSLTGATPWIVTKFGTNRNFNPRSLTGATGDNAKQDTYSFISIHAPLRERQLR